MSEEKIHELVLYTNRKFRSKKEKRYLTLDQIAVCIKRGDTVKIYKHETREDVTKEYLKGIFRYLDMNEEDIHNTIRKFSLEESVVLARAEQEEKLSMRKALK